jgi:hypothetical protein
MIKMIFVLIILAIFVLPFVLFIKVVGKNKAKQKSSSWKGKLIDKKHLEYEDDDSSYTKDLYTLYFETTEGEKIKLNVPQKFYESWTIGNKAEKKRESTFTRKSY